MGNCLVTKLKGSVNNPELPKLGGLRLSVHTIKQGDNQNMSFRIAEGARISVAGNGSFSIKGTTYTDHVIQNSDFDSEDALMITLSSGEYYLDITSVYSDLRAIATSIGTAYNYDIDCSILSYAENMWALYIEPRKLSGTFIPTRNLRIIEIAATVDFSDFHLRLGDNIEYDLIRNIKIYGNGIDAVYNIERFTSIELANIYGWSCLGITGEIETLCNLLYNKGKTSGTIEFLVPDCNVTDGGNRITTAYLAEKGASRQRIVATFTSSGWTKSYV